VVVAVTSFEAADVNGLRENRHCHHNHSVSGHGLADIHLAATVGQEEADDGGGYDAEVVVEDAAAAAASYYS
jgi:hypothetical protein